MNRVLLGFLLRRGWWVWPFNMLFSVMAGWMGTWPLLGMAVFFPFLFLISGERSEGMLRTLAFLAIRRVEAGRCFWWALVLLPWLLSLAGMLSGQVIAMSLGADQASFFTWTRALVAAAHVGSLAALVFLAMTSHRHSRLARHGSMLPNFSPLIFIMATTYLSGERGTAFNAYLDSAPGIGVAHLFLPMAVLAWRRASLFHVPPLADFQSEHTNRPRNRRGLQGERLVFAQEAGRAAWMTLSMMGAMVCILWILGSLERDAMMSFGWILIMPMMFLSLTPFPMRELRFQPMSTRKLACLVLTAPLVLASISALYLVWLFGWPGGWHFALTATILALSGVLAFWRVMALLLPTALAPFIIIIPMMAIPFFSWEFNIEVSRITVMGAVLGLLLMLFSFWWLAHLLKHGHVFYARNRQALARTAEVMAKRG